MKTLANIYRFVSRHPLTRDSRRAALWRFLVWQLRSRLTGSRIPVSFVNETKLSLCSGMSGGTGNIYAGLADFREMSFLLHSLREGDLFVDAGANIGAYTVLASAAVGADTVAVEPVLSTFRSLEANIEVNRIGHKVTAVNMALGERTGTVKITTGHDSVNHVTTAGEGAAADEVPLLRLDDLLKGRMPALLKLDVEGYERNVLLGAGEALESETLFGIIIEMNGSGERYGNTDSETEQLLKDIGFTAFEYDPFSRRIEPAITVNENDNRIFIRNAALVAQRLASAEPFKVLGRII